MVELPRHPENRRLELDFPVAPGDIITNASSWMGSDTLMVVTDYKVEQVLEDNWYVLLMLRQTLVDKSEV